MRTNNNRYRLNSSVRGRRHLNCSVTTDKLDAYKLEIAKEVASFTSHLIDKYRGYLEFDAVMEDIELSPDHERLIIKYDRDVDFAENHLTEAILNFAVEAATFSDDNPANR